MRWVDPFIAGALLLAAWQWGSVLAEKRSAERAIRSAAERVAGAGGSRLAIPEPLRWGVGEALALGVEPVLYDPADLPPQLLHLRDAAWVVAEPERAEQVAAWTLENEPLGARRLLRVDLASAARSPLAPGEELTLPYARPFHYNPLGPSLWLRPGAPVRFAFHLDAGAYTLVLEAFHTRARATCHVRLQGTGEARRSLEAQLALRGIVQAPFEVRFQIPAGDPLRLVSLELSVSEQVAGGRSFLQRLTLRKDRN